MATVTKRKWAHNGVQKEAWRVRYIDHGGTRRSKTFDRKKDADAYRLRAEMELEAGTHVAYSKTVTLNEAAEAWLQDNDRRWRIGDLTGATVKRYEYDSRRHILPRLGAVKLVDLTAL